MPLRVWRTDMVVPLGPHPNDPGWDAAPVGGAAAADGTIEFFTTFTVTAPGSPDRAFDEAEAAEAVRTRELAGQGFLQRLWALPGRGRALGLWWAHDADQMQVLVASLPLRDWFGVETTQLSAHPSDPASKQR
jgi:muconolactone delta-isomerase